MTKEWMRKYKRERERAKKSIGQCRNCPLPAMPGRTRCAYHQERQRLYNKNYRDAGREDDDSPAIWSAADRKLADAGRCKCGLLLPCHSCGPTIEELATSRVGEGGIAPRASSHSGNPKTGAAYR